MRILMLGNSFTFFNDMPDMLAKLIGAEVVAHTRGGARLAEQLNPNTRMGVATQAALREEKWDYVVLQEMSNGPITSPASFFSSVTRLCEQIRSNGAVPVLYATWAYQRGGAKLRAFGMDYDQMYQQLHQAYAQAAQDTGALMADVGTRFYQLADQQELYAQDSYHPSEAGSRLAAQVLAQTIQRGERRRMKFIHLSDLHLGKRVNEYSMLEDQRYILKEIIRIVDDEQPQGVLIAGDVYDKSVPTAEAVALLDDFLVQLSRRGLQVYLISGNHDSPERMAFGGRLMEQSGIHIAPVYNGTAAVYTLTDEYGPVHLYLLPFVKPAHVRRYFPDQEITSYTDAVTTAIQAMEVDRGQRNILVTHQFVTGATRCDSEEVSVGGTDQVDVSAFEPFDYVALGHLHGPQTVGRETVRYCGTPLKYSFSEAGHHKSVTVVELGEKGTVAVRTVPLTPLRDMVELRGSYDQLTLRDFYQGTRYPQDYVHITLTDEEDIPDGIAKLRVIYPHLMKLDYDNRRTRAEQSLEIGEEQEKKSPLELLDQFYALQNGQPMGEERRAFAQRLMESIWEGER